MFFLCCSGSPLETALCSVPMILVVPSTVHLHLPSLTHQHHQLCSLTYHSQVSDHRQLRTDNQMLHAFGHITQAAPLHHFEDWDGCHRKNLHSWFSETMNYKNNTSSEELKAMFVLFFSVTYRDMKPELPENEAICKQSRAKKPKRSWWCPWIILK